MLIIKTYNEKYKIEFTVDRNCTVTAATDTDRSVLTTAI